MPWLDINQERHHAYAGYVGMVELAREIDKALHNPFGSRRARAAPWETKPSEMFENSEPDLPAAIAAE